MTKHAVNRMLDNATERANEIRAILGRITSGPFDSDDFLGVDRRATELNEALVACLGELQRHAANVV